MKTTIFKLIVLVNLNLFAGAQTSSTKVLIYDFSKSTFVNNGAYNARVKPYISPVQFGDFFIIKIININTFKWNVVLKGNSVEYVTPMPSELQSIFRIQSSSYEEDQTKAPALAALGLNSMNKVKEQIDEKTRSGPDADEQELKTAMADLVEECEEFFEIVNEIAEIKFTRSSLINLSKQEWADHRTLSTNMPAILNENEMKRIYKEFMEYYAKASAAYSKAKSAASQVNGNGTTNLTEEELKAAKEKIGEAEQEINKAFNLFANDDYLKLIEDILSLQTALENPKNFEVSSAPIQADGDYIEFFAEINPVKVNSLLPIAFSKNFPVTIPVRGGLKVDFGVGPFGSFGSGSRDELYYGKEVSGEDSVTLQTNSNKNAITPGISAMMYFGARTGKLSRLACAFGVGAGFKSTEDVNFSLFLGPGLVMGKRERVMISAGLSYHKVERINSNQYSVGGKYPSSLDINDVTSPVFRPSFFVSMVYNLTNRLEIK